MDIKHFSIEKVKIHIHYSNSKIIFHLLSIIILIYDDGSDASGSDFIYFHMLVGIIMVCSNGANYILSLVVRHS